MEKSEKGKSSKREDPETQKRFVLSEQPFAKERLAVLQEVVGEIKREHPEILSLCLFGSMVKGAARLESDMDGYLFVDAGLVATEFKKEESAVLEKVKDRTYFIDELHKRYSVLLREPLKIRLSLSDEQVKHLRVLPVSEQLLSKELVVLEKQAQENLEYKKAHEEWKKMKPGGESSEGATIPNLLSSRIEHEKLRPKHVSRPHPSLFVHAMFHLEVGGGIRKYRKFLLEKLIEMGEEGELAWKEIIAATEMLEQNLKRDTDKHYPRNLKDALAVYG